MSLGQFYHLNLILKLNADKTALEAFGRTRRVPARVSNWRFAF
jgi:hypothetical protein